MTKENPIRDQSDPLRPMMMDVSFPDLGDDFPFGRDELEQSIASIEDRKKLDECLPGVTLGENTVVLLDNNNIYRATKNIGLRMDYLKLKRIFEERCNLRSMVIFSALDRDDPQSLDWAKWVRKRGFGLVTKDLKRYRNRKGVIEAKGNLDVELTLAAMTLSDQIDHVIIGSRDGDFVPLVRELKKGHHRKVSILGSSGPTESDDDAPTGMSSDLIEEADNFYDLVSLKPFLIYYRPKSTKS